MTEDLIIKILDAIDRNVYSEVIEHNLFDSSIEWVVNLDNLKSQVRNILHNNASNDIYEHLNNMQHD